MNILIQLAAIFGICLAGEAVSALLPIVFPGSICAMLILLILLCTRLIKTEQLAPTSTWFQRNMAFFFLPANISIMEEFGLISRLWMQLVFIGVASAVVTFAAAAWAATLAIKVQNKLKSRAAKAASTEPSTEAAETSAKGDEL